MRFKVGILFAILFLASFPAFLFYAAGVEESALEISDYKMSEMSSTSIEINFYTLRAKAFLGDPKAQSYLGWSYQIGHFPLKQDYSEALKWYRRAAEQGDKEATYQVGGLYCSGEGVPKDCAEGLRWYLNAAERGAISASCTLAQLYEFGAPGVKQDYAEAYFWYSLSTDIIPCSGRKDAIALKITPQQKAAGDKRVAAWLKAPPGPPAKK
jgi:TPR repeat protein